ncbi:MAG: ATP-binding cassette domain-containing protein [Burkholderiaceae bacterium]|nr:ATP-binding cassette domain-containing protein [Burkholderiaceae bacterium]
MQQHEVILEAKGVEKSFGGVKALSRIDFTLKQGELRCLIGPNGAGKSTFFKLLSGQLKPTKGDIVFSGKSIVAQEPHTIARWGMGIKNQVPTVMDWLTANENLWLAARASYPASQSQKVVDEVIERLDLSSIASRLVGELAHGQRQWVEIGMVIIRKPKVVLLDEPAAGMSDEETVKTANLIKEINRTSAVVVVEHDMAFIQKIAELVTVFHQGKVLMESTFNDVVSNQRVRNVYLGRGIGE